MINHSVQNTELSTLALPLLPGVVEIGSCRIISHPEVARAKYVEGLLDELFEQFEPPKVPSLLSSSAGFYTLRMTKAQMQEFKDNFIKKLLNQ